MTQRPIDVSAFTVPPNYETRFGLQPSLEWIKISSLVVDDTYQRPITKEGKKNVLAIAARFRWSRFAPVVVSPIPGYKYAIVDGQHRVHAAKLVGIDSVPCQVITATIEEQAEAFGAINGNVTRISSLALHRAAVAAGDKEALRIQSVTRRAGVTVLRYPKPELDQEPGETMALGTIARAIRRYGDEVVILALRGVVETKNNVKGGLINQVVTATTTAVSELAEARRRSCPDEVIAAFERINLIREYGKSQTTERPPGTSISTILTVRVRKALFEQLRW